MKIELIDFVLDGRPYSWRPGERAEGQVQRHPMNPESAEQVALLEGVDAALQHLVDQMEALMNGAKQPGNGKRRIIALTEAPSKGKL